MQRYRSPGGLQRFVSVHSMARNWFSGSSFDRSDMTIHYHRMEAFEGCKSAEYAA